MKFKALIFCYLLAAVSMAQTTDKIDGVEIIPVEHASMVLKAAGKTIFVDPVNHLESFTNYGAPDIVLLTDIHGDHLKPEFLTQLQLTKSSIVAPRAVAAKLPENLKKKTTILGNGETKKVADIWIEAIPMYNLREEAKSFHSKGRGNGYVLTLNGKRVYISGDTEDIPEMRNLKTIDIAFVCMNLPYTMTVDKAADAVLDFAPKVVYPYHYRGQNGKSDVSKFKELIRAKNKNIQVKLLEWYP